MDNYISYLGDLNDVYTDAKLRFGYDLKAHQIVLPDDFKAEVHKSLKYLETDVRPLRVDLEEELEGYAALLRNCRGVSH